jgi:hypothetical protein
MTGFRYMLLSAVAAAVGFALTGANLAMAQMQKSDARAVAQAPIPAQNVVGEIADGEALFVDSASFKIAKGKAKGKDDPAVRIQKLRAGPLPQGAIIFRSGDQLYLAGAAPPAAYQTGVPPWAYQTGVPPWAYQTGVPPWAYQTGVPGWAYMQPGSPAAYQTGVPPWAYQTGVPGWAYMQSGSPAAYQTGVPGWAYMQAPTATDKDKTVSPAAYMRNAFDENFSW